MDDFDLEEFDDSDDLDSSDSASDDLDLSSFSVKSPLKAIRAKCYDCMCGSSYEIKNCPIVNCVLYPFRFGKNPFRTKRVYTEEELVVLRERMRNALKARAGE